MDQNVGFSDAVLRVMLAAFLCMAAVTVEPGGYWQPAELATSLLLMLTAISGYCPL